MEAMTDNKISRSNKVTGLLIKQVRYDQTNWESVKSIFENVTPPLPPKNKK